MGKSNVYMKRWLSEKTRFTNLVNGALFQGKQVFSADNIRTEDTNQGIVIRKPDGEEIIVNRYRDITMVSEDGTRIVILACEHQDEIHYAMPVRSMLYDALSYTEQIHQIKNIRKENKELKSSAEFLSGLKKSDLLSPVVTVIFYYGEEEWDGNQELHGLLGINREEYRLLKQYVPNYKINLIDPRRLDSLECFQTDLQMIFGMLKYRGNKEAFENYILTNKDYFSNIDEDSYNAARMLLKSENKLKEIKPGSGGINMCKALDDLYQDGVNEGRKQGIEQGIEQGIKALIQDYLEEGYSKEKIIEKLCKRFSLSPEAANMYFNR